MPYNPTWLPAWPSAFPDFETALRYIVPAQYPDGLYHEEGQARLDQEAIGIVFSWLRKGAEWGLQRFWPWLDDDALFLDRWESAFGLEPTGSVATRQRRVVASMRNRGTLTEAVLTAIFEWVFGTEDPADITVVAPTPAGAWGGAVNWTAVDWPFDRTLDIDAISGHGGAYIWGVGDAGMIKRFTTSWETVTSGTATNLNGVWAEPGNSNFAWAVGDTGTIREWNGSAWGAGPGSGPAGNINAVWGSGRYYNSGAAEYQTRYMWVAVDAAVLARYDRSAASWTTWAGTGTGNWLDVHALDTDDAVACSDTGQSAVWDGTSWTVATIDGAEDFHGIRKGRADGKIIAVGTNGNIYLDSGGGWGVMTSGTADHLYSLDGWETARLVAVGANGICLRYDGTNWITVRARTSKRLNSVWISRQTVDAMIAGEDGTSLNSPFDDRGFMKNQNSLHVYSTAQDLDPDTGIGDDKARLCEPAWGHISFGRRRVARASDTDGASGCDRIVAG